MSHQKETKILKPFCHCISSQSLNLPIVGSFLQSHTTQKCIYNAINEPILELKQREMPPRRSRRTAGKHPEQLEVVKDQGKLEVTKDEEQPGDSVGVVEEDKGKPGEDNGAGKSAAEGKEVKAEAVKNALVGMTSPEEKAKLETEEPSKTNKEDCGRRNFAENPDVTEASCEVQHDDDGKDERMAPNRDNKAQNTCRLGDSIGSGSSGEQENPLQITKKALSSSRRLNASSSEEEFYSEEEEVTNHSIVTFVLVSSISDEGSLYPKERRIF